MPESIVDAKLGLSLFLRFLLDATVNAAAVFSPIVAKNCFKLPVAHFLRQWLKT